MATKKISTTRTEITTTEETVYESTAASAAPELVIIDGQVFCTSLQVAEDYTREHFHVMRDVEEQAAKIREGRHAGKEKEMFQKSEYEITAGFGKVKKPMYLLNRDGFMKLVMGYNGQKASDTQMDYIAAFNKMEAKLLDSYAPKRAPLPDTISSAQLQEITRRVNLMADRTHRIQSTAYKLNNHLRFLFNLERLQEMHPADYARAIQRLDVMEKHFWSQFQPMMVEIEAEYISQYLCGNTPNTVDLKKKYHKQMQAVLPKPLNWINVAQTLGVAA